MLPRGRRRQMAEHEGKLVTGHVDGVVGVRFPRRERRQTLRPPEDTSMGAVPLKAAKRSRVGSG